MVPRCLSMEKAEGLFLSPATPVPTGILLRQFSLDPTEGKKLSTSSAWFRPRAAGFIAPYVLFRRTLFRPLSELVRVANYLCLVCAHALLDFPIFSSISHGRSPPFDQSLQALTASVRDQFAGNIVRAGPPAVAQRIA